MTSGGTEIQQDLMERRKAKGLSLLQIASATKIHLRYLEAIECGAFNKLPGGVYTESYIRQYARAVDDADGALLEHYRNVFAPQKVQPAAGSEPNSWIDRVRDTVGSIFGLTPDAPLRESKGRTA
jgi:cytoskeletal protein RodZ